MDRLISGSRQCAVRKAKTMKTTLRTERISLFFFLSSFSFFFSSYRGGQWSWRTASRPCSFARSICVFWEPIVKARRISGIKLTLPHKSFTRLSDYYVMLIWFSLPPPPPPALPLLKSSLSKAPSDDQCSHCRCFDTDGVIERAR